MKNYIVYACLPEVARLLIKKKMNFKYEYSGWKLPLIHLEATSEQFLSLKQSLLKEGKAPKFYE